MRGFYKFDYIWDITFKQFGCKHKLCHLQYNISCITSPDYMDLLANILSASYDIS